MTTEPKESTYQSDSELTAEYLGIDEITQNAIESIENFDVDRIFFKKHNILSRLDVKRMKEFKYSGHDYSFVHNWISLPFVQFICRFVPRWLSPNVITVSGLMLNVVAYFIISYYSYRFDGDIPSWVFYYAAFAMIGYYVLDILDGMVARKFKTGSPMGMLVDHGCDCVNTTLIAVNICSTLKLGSHGINLVYIYLYWVLYLSSFVNHTLLQYLTGYLKLDYINGSNEGVFLVAIYYTICGYFGQLDKEHGVYIIYLTTLLSVGENFIKWFELYKYCKEKQLNIKTSCAPLIYFYTIVISNAFWMWLEPDLFEQNPRIIFSYNASMATDILTELMIAHICARPYRGHIYKLLPLLYIGILNALTKYIVPAHQDLFDSYTLIYVVGLVAFFNAVRRAASVIKQMSTELNVPIFTVKPLKVEEKQE
ncbi:hypothetical protein WA158_001733 [Blastocystis sp. Blastoise]